MLLLISTLEFSSTDVKNASGSYLVLKLESFMLTDLSLKDIMLKVLEISQSDSADAKVSVLTTYPCFIDI